MTPTDQARHQYLTDAFFRRRVDQVVKLLEADCGVRLDPTDRSLAVDAVSLALMLGDGGAALLP